MNPNAFSLSKARSARILACDRSTHLLDLRQERIDDPPPAPRPVAGQLAGVALSDITGHSVMRHPGQLTGVTQRPTQVERFQHVHDFLARLHWLLLLDGHGCRDRPFEWEEHPIAVDPDGRWTSTRAVLLAAAGQNCWPPAGSYMAATGQDLMAADTPAPDATTTSADATPATARNEALRLLKRQLTKTIYRTLLADADRTRQNAAT